MGAGSSSNHALTRIGTRVAPPLSVFVCIPASLIIITSHNPLRCMCGVYFGSVSLPQVNKQWSCQSMESPEHTPQAIAPRHRESDTCKHKSFYVADFTMTRYSTAWKLVIILGGCADLRITQRSIKYSSLKPIFLFVRVCTVGKARDPAYRNDNV